MRKGILSLALTLALGLSLAVPAFAAGTKEVVTDKTHGVVVTMNEVLRKETHRYNFSGRYKTAVIYVLADNSTVTIEAMEGYRYATEQEADAWFNGDEVDFSGVAKGSGGSTYRWSVEGGMSGETNCFERSFGGPGAVPLTGTLTDTMEPSEQPAVDAEYEFDGEYPIYWMCESDFAKLVPFEGKPLAEDWAQEYMEKAYDAGLISMNPFKKDCTSNMTRAEFAAVAVNLYAAMQGMRVEELDVDSEHPFTDAKWDSYVGYAYNLGIVGGMSATTFAPDETLTREQAAVMLSQVYVKLHGAIPAVTATTFADDAQVSDWAKSSVAFMAGKGVVGGIGSNKFAPQNDLTIQEAVTMAVGVLEKLK